MTKRVPELLKELNDNPVLIENYKDNLLLKIIFIHSYLKDAKFILPDGIPPFKPAVEPEGMTPSSLLYEIKKLAIFTRADLTPVKREHIFIQLLESISPAESEILLAIKAQKFHKMYKKLNRRFAIKHGFIIDDRTKEESDLEEAVE